MRQLSGGAWSTYERRRDDGSGGRGSGMMRMLRVLLATMLATVFAVGGAVAPAYAAGAVDLVKELHSVQEGGNTTDIFTTGGLVRYKLKISCSPLDGA